MVSNGFNVFIMLIKVFQWFAMVLIGFNGLAIVLNGFNGLAMVFNGLVMVWQWFAMRRQKGDGRGENLVVVSNAFPAVYNNCVFQFLTSFALLAWHVCDTVCQLIFN